MIYETSSLYMKIDSMRRPVRYKVIGMDTSSLFLDFPFKQTIIMSVASQLLQ